MRKVLIERAFGLPVGFLSKDENLQLPEVHALLKIINTFPWMIHVADAGFVLEAAENRLIDAAINVLQKQKDISKARAILHQIRRSEVELKEMSPEEINKAFEEELENMYKEHLEEQNETN